MNRRYFRYSAAVFMFSATFAVALFVVAACSSKKITKATPAAQPPAQGQAQPQTQPSAQPAGLEKPKSPFPCDPIFISGITGECAGTGDPAGFAGEEFIVGRSSHPEALAPLPKDRFGLVDWADAIKSGAVKPQNSLNPQEPDLGIDMDVVIFTKSRFMPDVIFPHKVHEMWLTCTNCHPAIFPMNAKQANAMMTMPAIASGQFCGVCHNRVAFPLNDCLRCHIKPRDVPPIDPDAEKWGIQPMKVTE